MLPQALSEDNSWTRPRGASNLPEGEKHAKTVQRVDRFHLKCLFSADWATREGEVISTWGNLGRLLGGGDPVSEGSSLQ